MIIRRLFALALCVATIAGCSKASQTTTASGLHPWTIPGVLRLGEPDEPDSLNPLFANSSASDLAFGMLYTYILRYDIDGNYTPDLATEVPSTTNGGISKDNMTITIHLRKDAKWADGTPLNADDWMFTYHAVNNPANNVKSKYGWDAIASVDEPDKYTLVMHLSKPTVAALGILAPGGTGFPPLPKHLLGNLHDLNHVAFNTMPLASGPYILTAWNHGSSLLFAPNPYYFRGAPKLKQVVWKVIPDANTLFTQLQTHEIDVYAAVNESSVPYLGKIDGITVDKRLVANYRRLQFNVSRPNLRDVRVRKAIAEAVDWKRINDTIYHGYNVLASSDVFPLSWAAQPQIPRYPFDVADAKRQLAAAGWISGPDGILRRDGTRLHLQVSTSTSKQENIQAEVVMQSMLKAVGIEVEIRNYPASLLFAQNGPLYTGHYDMEWTIATNGADPDNSGSWAAAFIPPHGANTAWLDDPIVNRTSIAASETFDQAKRKVLYTQEEQRLHVLIPAVFFYWETRFTAMNTDVKGYKQAAFILDSWNSWEWQV